MQRIVSLVPSITELLFDLGLQSEIVGITKFCVHPKQWCQTKTKVGGTKNINLKAVASLQPQLIIANKEENVKEQVQQLQKLATVLVTDVSNFEEALKMISHVGTVTGKISESEQLISTIIQRSSALKIPVKKLNVCYVIWKQPYMVAGGGTFISSMLQQAGFNNFFADKNRYPSVELTEETLKHCDVVMLSSEPFPFTQKHIEELQQHLPSKKIILADGEMFSWYGSRMQLAPDYFQTILKVLQSAYENL